MRGRRRERLGSRVGTRYKPAIRRLSRTAVRWGPQFSSSAPPRSPAPSFDHFPFGPAILRRRVPSGTCTGVRQNFSHGQQAGATGEEAAEGRKCEGGAGNGFGSRVGYTIQTCDPSVSRTAVRWGPRFSSSAPPRSPAPSFAHFSLWARHPAETSAELNVRLGAAEFFPGDSRRCDG